MLKKLDSVLGRSFTTKKLESLLGRARAQLNLSMSKFQEEVSRATSDVTKLLKLGQHKKAYRKADIVIKKQNNLNVYTLIIGYLDLLMDDIDLFKPNRDIPEKLLEAVSSLLFAAPRIRLAPYFTAIQDVRNMLLSRFGQNLAAQYLELRNNCGINPQIIEKLSKEPSLREVRMEFLKEIAAKENIVLKLEEASTSTEGTSDVSKAKLASEERVEDETREGCGLSDPDKRVKKKQIDVADAERAVGNSSTGPENKKAEQEGNENGSAKRGKTKQKGKKKLIDVAEKAVGSSSNGPQNKESEQKREDNGDGSAKKGKKKLIDVADKTVGSSSNGPQNKESEQEQEGNDDGSFKGGKKKQIDVAEKAVGNSSNGPQNKESEQEGNDDGSAKKGKNKQIDVAEKAVGTSSKGPQNKKPEQEQEGNDDDSSDGEGDVRSQSKRLMSGSGETIKLDEDTVELLEKDVDINWTGEETGNVDHMVHSVEDTTGLKGPFSVRTRRLRKQ